MQFAPIRRLHDGSLAGAELQLRGPADSALGSASALRRAAQLMAQRAEFDDHKRVMAHTDAAMTVAERLPLVVTIDSASRGAIHADGASTHLERIVVTIGAMEVLGNPHSALAAVATARAEGKLVALDGVGADRHGATLLALVEPDIIITAPEFLEHTDRVDVGTIAHALSAYLERSHAIILAEGVDDENARLAATTIGATYGTGALYPAVDDPADLLTEEVVPMPAAPVWSTPAPGADTPYAIASTHAQSRRGTKRLLVQMSKALESHAASTGTSMIALGTFQHAHNFTDLSAERWRRLADTIGFAGVYGVGLPQMVDGNIHHAPLDHSDDLVDEWTVVVLGPHHAALLSARDRHDNGPDLDRTFDFVQSYDRVTVTQAAHSIMRRYTAFAG